MPIQIPIFIAGLAALTWEVLWFHYAALAIGVSAHASAIVLSAMMLGTAVGSLATGALLRKVKWERPAKMLTILESFIGLCGLFLAMAFQLVEKADILTFRHAPTLAPLTQALGITLVLGLPALAMGATIPVFARIAGRFSLSIAGLYATNVAGAAFGILFSSFVLIPELGIEITVGFTACLNLLAALFAFVARAPRKRPAAADRPPGSLATTTGSLFQSSVVVFCTGFTTFVLEVVWFRSLRSALQATTESFALMLSATLIALAVGGYLAPILRRRGRFSLSLFIALAGFLVLTVTPAIERFDIFVPISGAYWQFLLKRFLVVLALLGPPMAFLGIGLPWILDRHARSSEVSLLYAVNTIGAVVGALGAAWILLPRLGLARSAWIAGAFLIAASLVLARGKGWIAPAVLCLAGFAVAVPGESGLGRLRVQGLSHLESFREHKVLASREGPDATVSVVEDSLNVRHLVIDGFYTAGEGERSHYMVWMGRLPMILHPDPEKAMVICFGTGQTANAVRLEDPAGLDVIDVSPAVFEVAPLFTRNQSVLNDPRCRKIVMDGRAWLRRTTEKYDVITLEPMSPHFAGSNALYSIEFYRLMKLRLNEGGVAAQWLPFHLVDAADSASIVATFMEVFSGVRLWVDPVDRNGVLLGFNGDQDESGPLTWYGLDRGSKSRDLSKEEIIDSTIFDEDTLKRFSRFGGIITDDNQLLSYGYGRMKWSGLAPHHVRQMYIINLLHQLSVG